MNDFELDFFLNGELFDCAGNDHVLFDEKIA